MNRLHSFAAASTTFLFALLASSAVAHPGHNFGDHGPMHLVSSPYHLAVLAGAGAALWFVARFTAKRLPRLGMQTLGVLLVIAAGALWGLRA